MSEMSVWYPVELEGCPVGRRSIERCPLEPGIIRWSGQSRGTEGTRGYRVFPGGRQRRLWHKSSEAMCSLFREDGAEGTSRVPGYGHREGRARKCLPCPEVVNDTNIFRVRSFPVSVRCCLIGHRCVMSPYTANVVLMGMHARNRKSMLFGRDGYLTERSASQGNCLEVSLPRALFSAM